jgi:hypothetical protein
VTGYFDYDNEPPGSVKVGVFLDQLSDCHPQEASLWNWSGLYHGRKSN